MLSRVHYNMKADQSLGLYIAPEAWFVNTQPLVNLQWRSEELAQSSRLPLEDFCVDV